MPSARRVPVVTAEEIEECLRRAGYRRPPVKRGERRVWACETLNYNGKWVIWYAHKHRANVFESMREGRKRFPKNKFRTVPYFPNHGRIESPC